MEPNLDSIKERLNIGLILVLVGIVLLFACYLIVLYLFGLSLTPEAYAQIISALATVLVVILTLGLRLMDDALTRFENFVKPRLISLSTVLGPSGAKNELKAYHSYNLPSRSKDLLKTSSSIERHGRFFLTKLYPQKSVEKAKAISRKLDDFLSLVSELKPYWEATDFDIFLEFSIRHNTADSKNAFSTWPFLDQAKEKVAKLERDKPNLIGQIETLRKETLCEIDKTISELNDFVEAN
jgi:hypothetical protein